MSEKSPSDIHKECREKALKSRDRYFKKVEELTKGKCICTDEWLASHDIEVRNQTLADVLKIAKRFRMYNYDGFVEEIKKIQSQGANSSGEYQKNAISDIPKDSIKDGETGFVNHKRCAPDTNTQNLKGCGEKHWIYNPRAEGSFLVNCCEIHLCEKCQEKVQS